MGIETEPTIKPAAESTDTDFFSDVDLGTPEIEHPSVSETTLGKVALARKEAVEGIRMLILSGVPGCVDNTNPVHQEIVAELGPAVPDATIRPAI